jgi:sortase A
MRVVEWTRVSSVASLLLLLLSLVLCSQALWIHVKARLAQHLIAQAWERTLVQPGSTQKPWRWADTWPVMRLQWPAGGEDLYVLAGSTGNALAFGPGLAFGTAAITQGASVVAAHRDTHFAFLQQLKSGDTLRVQNEQGLWSTYRVAAITVEDSREGPLLLDPSRDSLTLVTCYPFDAITPGGPLRYVVTGMRYNF